LNDKYHLLKWQGGIFMLKINQRLAEMQGAFVWSETFEENNRKIL
jgi:hypothetical protein